MTNAILYENGDYWVTKAPGGYQIMLNGPTAARVVGTIGSGFTNAFELAKAECDRRANRGHKAPLQTPYDGRLGRTR